MKRTPVLILLAAAACSTPQSRIKKDKPAFDSYPSAVQERIKSGQVDVGFTHEQVELSLGRPDRKYVRKTAASVQDVWAYSATSFRPGLDLGFGAASGGGFTSGATGMQTESETMDAPDRARVVFPKRLSRQRRNGCRSSREKFRIFFRLNRRRISARFQSPARVRTATISVDMLQRRRGIRGGGGAAALGVLSPGTMSLLKFNVPTPRLAPSFFRPAVELKALSHWVRHRAVNSDKPLRVWVPSCATGEDAYTVAIGIFDALGSRWREIELCVLATHSDEDALARARAGR